MAYAWFRLYFEWATDPKIQMLSEVDQRRFIMLLCLRCGNGHVTLHETGDLLHETKVALHETKVAFQLRISEAQWDKTKAHLLAQNLIDELGNPTAWDKRQFVSDSSTARVSKHRSRKKQAAKEAPESTVKKCNVTVTPPDTDTDTDIKNTCAKGDPFDAFWAAYPKKKSKGAAEKVWNRKRLGNGSFDLLMAGLERAKASDDWTKDGGKFIQYPATWLNARGWEDEPTTTGQPVADSSRVKFEDLPTSL